MHTFCITFHEIRMGWIYVLYVVEDFRQSVEKCGQPSTSGVENHIYGKLYTLVLHQEGKHNDCKDCSKRKAKVERKPTVYFCETCKCYPYLYVAKCFKKYHIVKDYKN